MNRLNLSDALAAAVVEAARAHRPVRAAGYPPVTTVRLDADTTAFFNEIARRTNASFGSIVSMSLTAFKDAAIMDARQDG